jgi:hypothetical protein
MSFLAIPEVLLEGAGAVVDASEAAGAAAEVGGAAEEGAVAAEETTSTAGEIERGVQTAEDLMPSRGGGVEEVVERRVELDVSIRGAEKVERDLRGISRRADNLYPVLRKEMDYLEHRELLMFAGRYVDTGALAASLTQSQAVGAVREITPHSLKFGSTVWYGKYQVVNPGPVTAAGGLRRSGHESAIMHKLTPEERNEVTREVGNYIMHGRQGMIRI